MREREEKMNRSLIVKLSLLISFCTMVSQAMAVELTDVTKAWTFRYNVVSAFPNMYKQIPQEENADIIRVLHYSVPAVSPEAGERRIEVFYTGGDWMQYGLTYLVSNAENPLHKIYADKAAAYFIPKLSTTDRENGSVPPEVNPMDLNALLSYVVKEFLDSSGKVRDEFAPVPVN